MNFKNIVWFIKAISYFVLLRSLVIIIVVVVVKRLAKSFIFVCVIVCFAKLVTCLCFFKKNYYYNYCFNEPNNVFEVHVI